MAKIFSGMRPSGKLHLGNYLGAIKNWIALQDDAQQSVYAVVDLHGITTPYDPKTYQEQVHDVILDYLAAGVDPKKSLLIRQSKIPQHSQLMWLLSTITPVGWLERLPNWREKVHQIEEMGDRGASYQNNLGLLSYPVLMAADILVYRSDTVPVGEDQALHLELANEVGAKFNYLFGETFPKIKPHIVEGARIMSLQDPTKKMSKTGDDGIALTDSPDEVRSKIKRAATDSGKEIVYNEVEKPGIANLLTIYSTLSRKEIPALEEEYQGKSYTDFKSDLTDVVIQFLEPFQKRRAVLAANPGQVEQMLTDSEERARIMAAETIELVENSMGLRTGT